jgi:hypothetical protein
LTLRERRPRCAPSARPAACNPKASRKLTASRHAARRATPQHRPQSLQYTEYNHREPSPKARARAGNHDHHGPPKAPSTRAGIERVRASQAARPSSGARRHHAPVRQDRGRSCDLDHSLRGRSHAKPLRCAERRRQRRAGLTASAEVVGVDAAHARKGSRAGPVLSPPASPRAPGFHLTVPERRAEPGAGALTRRPPPARAAKKVGTIS